MLRMQLYEWQFIGLTVPMKVHQLLKDALSKFSGALVEPDGGGEAAQEALRIALDASRLLAASRHTVGFGWLAGSGCRRGGRWFGSLAGCASAGVAFGLLARFGRLRRSGNDAADRHQGETGGHSSS